MELYIFDKELNFQGILEVYTSLIWRRRYSKHGDFELHCALTIKNLELLKKGNIVWKNDDEEAGYIKYRNLSMDNDGDEALVVSGKFLTGYLNRRIIWGTENLNTTSELAVRELIDKNVINPSNTERKIGLMALGEVKGYPQTTNMQTSYDNLLDKVEEIANTNELGIRTILDLPNKKIVFDIYEGLDRTEFNGVNAPAIFSREFENVLEQEYTDSDNNFRNLALVAGEGEGSARVLEVIGSGTDLDRYEVFIDAKDLQKDAMTDLEYKAKLVERGNTKLAEYKDIQTFDSKINLNSNLEYKVDFNLGDKVTCVSKAWGITIDTRITEIEEVYEASGKQINVTFGNEIPTLIDKIRQVVN
jgi:hypothetical protein